MATRLILSAILVWSFAAAAFGQFETDSNAPIEITSDTMEWLNEERIAIARGNADAVQGRYKLHADILKAYLSQGSGESADKIKLITANGNVSLTTPEESARGETGEYNVEKGIVELTGSVVLTQGTTVLNGDKLVMDLNSGRSVLEGSSGSGETAGTSGGRVTAVFTPESQSASEDGE